MSAETLTLAEIKRESGLTLREISERFGIPRRTLEDWSAGVRVPPDYVLRMMQELLAK